MLRQRISVNLRKFHKVKSLSIRISCISNNNPPVNAETFNGASQQHSLNESSPLKFPRGERVVARVHLEAVAGGVSAISEGFVKLIVGRVNTLNVVSQWSRQRLEGK